MRTKVTLILLFLNVALFFFIFKFERGWRTEQASLEARRRVLGAETADIRSISISGPGLTTVQLQRKDNNWNLTDPIEWPANPHAVSRIINELQFLEHETSFSVADLEKNNQSLADYGLDHPRLTVAFTSGVTAADNSGDPSKPVTLEIGDETKVGNRLYVLSPDHTRVHVVNLSLANSLTIPVANLRADTVFSIPVFEARSLNLQNATNLRVRVRRDGNHWTFESPIIARASDTTVKLTINALNALRVHKFVPANSAEHNPANNPTLRITLEGNNRRETLILGERIGTTAITTSATDTDKKTPATAPDVEYYAILDGKATLFTLALPDALINALLNAQIVLRETRIIDFSPDNVTAITLDAPNQSQLTLQRLESTPQPGNRNNSSWQIVRRTGQQGPQTQPADDKDVQHLIEKLSLLSAEKFVSDAPSDADLEAWGFNRPEREITLTLGSGNDSQKVSIQIGVGSQPEGHTYVRLTNARYVYLVNDSILNDTPVSPLDYRERLLRELPEAATISRLQITDLKDNRVIYDQEIGKDDAALDERTKALIAPLRALTAKRFVQDKFVDQVEVTGEQRPWRYRLDTTVTLPSGSGEQKEVSELFLSPRLGGATQLAGSPALDAVFEVSQPLLDALWAVTYDAPGPPPPEVETPPTPVEKTPPAAATETATVE